MGFEGATVFGRSSHTGIIVGCSRSSTVSFCYAIDSKVTGSNSYTGGLVGSSYFSTVIGCYYTGSVAGWGIYTGGLVGYNYGSNVRSSYSKAEVLSDDDTCGVFVGYELYNSEFSNCYWEGTVNGSNGPGIGTSETSGISSEVSQAGDNGVAWSTAVAAMNTAAITEYGWKYELGSDGLPYLTNGM